MKVLNLRCAHDHRFEGWFGSENDYSGQVERGLIACPLCDDTAIERLPSAPRLNVTTQRGEAKPPPAAKSNHDAKRALESPVRAVATAASDASAPLADSLVAVQRQALWLHAMREAIARTEDVGERFPEEARRIHYGESTPRGIRGQASREEAEALRDEGIEVVGVPLPELLKGPVQ